MPRTIETIKIDEGDPLPQAIAMLVWHAMHGGVRDIGDKMTMIVPPMDIGKTRATMMEAGEWEIVVKRVA